MPRKPVGDVAMTGAERLRKFRERQRQARGPVPDTIQSVRAKLIEARKEIERLRQHILDLEATTKDRQADPVMALDRISTRIGHEQAGKAKNADKKRLDKIFETKVGEEVRRRIDAAKDATRKQNAKLREEILFLTQMLGQKALFSPAEFKTILRCLHPDNSASPEIRARAFDLVRQKERRLVGR